MSEKLKQYISLAAEAPLSREKAEKAFSIIMDGEATDASNWRISNDTPYSW
jgi:anthranilate phosphoribosyltransferase